MSNHADKRSVSTDALDTLGTIITSAEKRDAIHLAVEPIEAGDWLNPGQDVLISDGKALPCAYENGVGIVDPFLRVKVAPGDWFWLTVYPRQIKSLRHVWTHPAFDDEPVRASATGPSVADASELWLRRWIVTLEAPISYEQFIALVTGVGTLPYGWTHEGHYLLCRGMDAHDPIPAEVWQHVRNATGMEPIGEPERFSCSC